MKVVTMTCPGTCGKRYKITISDKDLASSTWTCPNCGYSAPFSVIAQMGHKPDNMPPISNKDKTVINNDGTGNHTTPASPRTQFATAKWELKIIGTNFTIPLPVESGKYVMGRNSGDSTATIKVAPDRTISREHAMLYIKNQGGNFTFHIMGLKDNNPILINNQILPARRIVMLQENATIKMGKVSLMLIKKQA